MKVVNKKLSKAQLTTICLLIISVVLSISCLVISEIAKKRAEQNALVDTSYEPLDLLEGESSYLNQPIAYPAIRESQILLLEVVAPGGKKSFDLSRYPDDQGSFMLSYYVDGEKNAIPYVPPIYIAEDGFNYESLYAIEQNDGYGQIYCLTYLCSAIGTPYFRERIELPKDNPDKRNALLEEYGLTQSESTLVGFVYGERDAKTGLIIEGSEKKHTITIGRRDLSGVGFYFMVDDRDCVYYTNSDYFKYALKGFESFVKGMLVAEGLAEDSSFEPYLTTDFRTWVGQTYKDAEDKITIYNKEQASKGYENPEVIVTGYQYTSVDKSADTDFIPDDSDFNGYSIEGTDSALWKDGDIGKRYSFDLEYYKTHADFERIAATFNGKNVGSKDMILTLLTSIYGSQSKLINFSGAYGEQQYLYTVTAIESVINPDSEITQGKVSDAVSSENSLVKITYTYSNETNSSKHDCHAVIALKDLSKEDRNAVLAQDIGELPVDIVIEINYTKDLHEYSVTKINYVIGADGKKREDGKVLATDKEIEFVYSYRLNGTDVIIDQTVTVNLEDTAIVSKENRRKFRNCEIGVDLEENKVVYFRTTETNAKTVDEKLIITEIMAIYDKDLNVADTITDTSYVVLSGYGIFNGITGKTENITLRLSDIKDDDRFAALKAELIGKGKGKFDEEFTAYNDTYYYEYMRDFVTYEITEIKYFVENEIIVAFSFCQPSERDPYYGETFFKNDLTNDYRLYGLNSDSCEQVVKYFGGLGSTTNTSVGFSGTTVAVGLTLDNIETYGLFAHRIYFELPRGIEEDLEGIDPEDYESEGNYKSDHVLGFTLYISDATYDEDNNRVRYIGSDMYDLVAKVPADNLDFLEKSFVEFWARKNIILMDVTKVEELNIDFNMQDYQGSYNFSVQMQKIKYEGSDDVMEEQLVEVTPSEDAFGTKLTELMNASGLTKYSLTSLYNQTMGNGKMTYYEGSYDTLGTVYFNTVYEIVQLTRYQGILTDEERAAALKIEPILTINLKVRGNDNYYTYKFHRLDDRRIMVSLYYSDVNGDMRVSDFYITAFAFKKIVGNYIKLLNGQDIDSVVGYPI